MPVTTTNPLKRAERARALLADDMVAEAQITFSLTSFRTSR
jgi:hypothetical protein